MNKFFNLIHRHRFDILFSILLIGLIYLVIVFVPQKETMQFIDFLENKTFDIRQNITAKEHIPSKDIVVITVDDPSYEYLLSEYGDWPVPRSVYAEILDYIQAQNPKYVAFDLLFIKSLNRIPGSDDKLIEAFSKYKNVFTAINFDDPSHEVRKPPLLPNNIKTDINIKYKNLKPHYYPNCRSILQEIMEVTDNVGHINTPKDDDGVTRVVPSFITYPLFDVNNNYEIIKPEYYAYMTIKMFVDYLNKYENQNITEFTIDEKGYLLLGNRKIPLTSRGDIILNWYKKCNDQVSYEYVPFWKVLKSHKGIMNGDKPHLEPNFFKDKIVFIGTSVFGLYDIKTVPIGKYVPGVELHSTLFNNLLENAAIKRVDYYYDYLIAFVLSILSIIFVWRIRSVFFSTGLFLSSVAFYLYLSIIAMSKYNLWIGIVIPITISLLIFIASFLVKYLLKSRDFEYTYKLATTDGLTELYNHRFFQEEMKNKVQICNKQGKNFSLLYMDIDFFKKFNDTYGHQAGDAVLKHVAKTLKSCVRTEDFVCRYGGEEMAIILNNANREIAVSVAQKICKTIAEKSYELTPDLEVKITISIGVASYPENGKTPSELIEYADKCLYNAKENGRNQVGFIE